jgi:hypothetical protein
LKKTIAALLMMSASAAAHAHSASDAYLDLTVDTVASSKAMIMHGQWDIALRDLDFVLNLDQNGDGHVTWGEVRHRQAAIEKYAYSYLHFEAGSTGACTVKPTRQMIDNHADGAYAALFFDVTCGRFAKAVAIDYRLFFAIDPSHRAILILHSADNASTALLSPQNARVNLAP